jgi:hypothetical protein
MTAPDGRGTAWVEYVASSGESRGQVIDERLGVG